MLSNGYKLRPSLGNQCTLHPRGHSIELAVASDTVSFEHGRALLIAEFMIRYDRHNYDRIEFDLNSSFELAELIRQQFRRNQSSNSNLNFNFNLNLSCWSTA